MTNPNTYRLARLSNGAVVAEADTLAGMMAAAVDALADITENTVIVNPGQDATDVAAAALADIRAALA